MGKLFSSILLVLFLYCIAPLDIYAQLNITSDLPVESNELKYDDLWNLRISNFSDQSQTVYLSVRVNNIGLGEILRLETSLSIPSGEIYLYENPAFSFNNVKKEFVHPDFEEIISKSQTFPQDEYSINWEIQKSHAQQGDQLRANHIINVKHNRNSQTNYQSKKNKQRGNKKNTNSHIGFYSFIPQDTLEAYIQTDAKIGFNLGKIPFYIDALLVTNSIDQENINRIGVHFDANAYRNKQRKEVMKKIGSLQDSKHDEIASLDRINQYLGDANFDQEAYIKEQKAALININKSFRATKELELKKWIEQYNQLKFKKAALEEEIRKKDRKFNLEKLSDLSSAIESYDFYTLNKTNNFWLHTDRLSLGHSYPYYSPLTINGSRIFGFDWAYNKKSKYLSISAGRLQSSKFLPTPNTYENQPDTLESRHNRNIVATKFGLGFSDGNHLFFTFMHAYDVKKSLEDDLQNIQVEANDFPIKPKSNSILASEFLINLLPNNILYFEGEISSSTIKHNTYIPSASNLFEDVFEKLPIWSRWLGTNIETSHNYAYSGSLVLKPNSSSNLRLKYLNIESGYESFAVPFIRNDLNRIEIRGNQSIFKRKINLTGFYRRDHDNLIDSLKSDRAYFNTWGGNIKLNKVLLSSISIGYRKSQQKSGYSENSTSSNSSYQTSLAHRYKSGNLRHLTMFTFGLFNSNNNENAGALLYNIHHKIKLQIPLEFSGQLYVNRRDEQQTTQFDLSTTYLWKKCWKNQLGYRFYNNDLNTRNTYYLESGINLKRNITGSIYLERNNFRNPQNTNYPFAIRVMARYKW